MGGIVPAGKKEATPLSRNRLIKMVALVGCSVLIGAFGYTPAATAHIGASHAPFNSDRPDLLSARIDGTNVIACFDVDLDSILAEEQLSLVRYDSFREHTFDFTSGDGTIPTGSPKCVQLDASNAASLEQHRI